MPGLRFSQQSLEDLHRIHDEGIGQFGIRQAEKYIAELQRTTVFLSEYPFAARERLEFDPPVRIHPFRSHVIVYRLDTSGVLILRVRHAHEDWDQNPTD